MDLPPCCRYLDLHSCKPGEWANYMPFFSTNRSGSGDLYPGKLWIKSRPLNYIKFIYLCQIHCHPTICSICSICSPSIYHTSAANSAWFAVPMISQPDGLLWPSPKAHGSCDISSESPLVIAFIEPSVSSHVPIEALTSEHSCSLPCPRRLVTVNVSTINPKFQQ